MQKNTAGKSGNSGSTNRRFSLDYLQSIANISPIQDVEIGMNATMGHMQRTRTTVFGAAIMEYV